MKIDDANIFHVVHELRAKKIKMMLNLLNLVTRHIIYQIVGNFIQNSKINVNKVFMGATCCLLAGYS